MTIAWLLIINIKEGLHDGGALRYFHLSRELVAAGHRVYYIVARDPAESGRLREYLAPFVAQRYLTGYFELDLYPHPYWRGKLARLLIHPAARSWALRSAQRAFKQEIFRCLEQIGADVCIIGNRYFLFLFPEILSRAPAIVDWVDSFTLYHARALAASLRAWQFRRLPGELKRLLNAVLDESFYGRTATANLLASPVDKRCFDRLTRRPRRNRVLPNGTRAPAAPAAEKIPGRLIFTGRMDFPPNHEAAVWFIDNVLPLVRGRRPEAHLIVAGRGPQAALLERAKSGVRVAGYVPDLTEEVARSQLFVAPMVSGSGFKNKVVEALMAGTFVLGTSIALEFLDPALRELLLVADTPREFAGRIVGYLENPGAFAERLAAAQRKVESGFRWTDRGRELMGILNGFLGA